MLDWLDNSENHKDAPNENYGRELLELFSMGVGNYSEADIKMAARAFTGWTYTQPIPLYPYGFYPAHFVYRPDDHDDSVKTFLGKTGRFNGEDIVEAIVKKPATARFIARHLYNFFVADEPQVPAWNQMPPQDPQAISALARAYFDSGGDLRAMLRVLFHAAFLQRGALSQSQKSGGAGGQYHEARGDVSLPGSWLADARHRLERDGAELIESADRGRLAHGQGVD